MAGSRKSAREVCRKSATRIGLPAILLGAHGLLARTKTSPHLAIHAAGVIRTRGKIFLASPQLEQIEKFGFEMRGGGLVAERPEVHCWRTPDVGRHLSFAGNAFDKISFT